MTESLKNFVEAIERRSFTQSFQILTNVLDSAETLRFSTELRDVVESNTLPKLMIRDHIFSYLDIEPFYFALDIPSYDIIRVGDGCHSQSDASGKILLWLSEYIDSGNSLLRHDVIDTTILSQGRHARLLPSILASRMKEFEDATIPVSRIEIEGVQMNRYSLIRIYRTSFGRRVFSAIKSYNSPIVGEKGWFEISTIFNSAGLDLSNKLVEVSAYDWHYKVEQEKLEIMDPPTQSGEIEVLRELRYALQDIVSEDRRVRIRALENIKNAQTSICNGVLLELVREGTGIGVELALDILVMTGDSRVQDELGEILGDKSNPHRATIAQSISALSSLDLVRATDGPSIQIPPRPIISRKMNLESVTDVVLRELLLVFSHEPSNTGIFHKVAQTGDSHLLHRILTQSEVLSDEHAFTIISMGLADASAKVREEARRQFIERWPERDPDQVE